MKRFAFVFLFLLTVGCATDSEFRERLNSMNARINLLEFNQKKIRENLAVETERLNRLESELSKVSGKYKGLNTKIYEISSKLDEIKTELVLLEGKLEKEKK